MPNLLASLLSRWRHPGTDALSQYLDGLLTPQRESRIARHLSICDRCQSELESLRLTVGLLRRVPQEEPPRSFTFSAPPLLERQPRMSFGAPNWTYAAAGGALALLFAVLLSADMVGLLTGGDDLAEEATVQVYEAQSAPQALAESSGEAPLSDASASASAPLAASPKTPLPPPIEQYSRSPVEPIEEEALPPAGESSDALVVEEVSQATREGASTGSEPMDVDELTQEIIDRMQQDGPVSEDLAQLVRAIVSASEAMTDQGPKGSESTEVAQSDQQKTVEVAAAPLVPTPPPPTTPTPAAVTIPAATPIPTAAPAATPTSASTPRPTPTAAPAVTATPAATPTAVPAVTPAPTPPPTAAPTPAATPRPIPTATSVPATPAPTPRPTAVITIPATTPIPTSMPTSVHTPTPLPTAAPTPVRIAAAPSPPSPTPKPIETPTPRVTLEAVPAEESLATDSMAVEPTAPRVSADQVDPVEADSTSIWWRALEGLLGALALLVLGLFFWRWWWGHRLPWNL